jgi:hypothetical protein
MQRVTLPSGEEVDVESARLAIALVLRYWLDSNQRSAEASGIQVTGDTHVIPPKWPTREQLENWIATLQA